MREATQSKGVEVAESVGVLLKDASPDSATVLFLKTESMGVPLKDNPG